MCSITRDLVTEATGGCYWSVCVEWTPGRPITPAPSGTDRKSRIDYREVLPPDQFAIYSKLRELRKEFADKEGVPPYAVFTNEHLADMVRKKITTTASLQTLEGVGPAKVEKYGDAFLKLLTPALSDTESNQSDTGELSSDVK